MKKLLLLVLTVCMTSLCALLAHAQSSVTTQTQTDAAAAAPTFIGTWTLDALPFFGANDNEVTAATFILTVTPTDLVIIDFDASMAMNADGMEMLMDVHASMPGSYKAKGDTISLNMLVDKVQFDVRKFDVQLDAAKETLLKSLGMTKDDLLKQLRESIDPSLLAPDMGDLSGDLVIERLTASEMVLRDEDGLKLPFQRK